MSGAGDCKVGRTSRDPERRRKQLQTGCSEELRVVGTFKTRNSILMERMLHMHYKGKKKTGEWFALDDDDVLGFCDLCVKLESAICKLEEGPYVKKEKDENGLT